jgi:hypothetical protein
VAVTLGTFAPGTLSWHRTPWFKFTLDSILAPDKTPNRSKLLLMNTYHTNRPLGIFAALGLTVSILTAMLAAAATDAPSSSGNTAEPFAVEDVALFIDQHCATCHNDTDTEGDLDITALKFTPDDPDNLEAWEKIYDTTESGEMPPKEKRRPREAAKKEFLEKLGAALKIAEAKNEKKK